MKYIIGLFLLVVMAQTAFSQDLIVTSDDVQLNCKITKLSSKEIHYSFIKDGVVKDSSLSRQLVKEFKFDRFAVNDTLEAIAIKNKYHYRVALNLSSCYLMNLFSDDASDPLSSYYKDLKSGIQVGGDFTYYVSGTLGVGMKYSRINSKNSALLYNENHVQSGILSDDINITFIGPSVSTRFPGMKGNNAFIVDLSMGYMEYTDDIVVINRYSEKGSTIGYSLGLGYDLGISKKLAIGIQLSMYTGRLSEHDMTNNLSSLSIDFTNDSYKRLERFDLSVGFRFLN